MRVGSTEKFANRTRHEKETEHEKEMDQPENPYATSNIDALDPGVEWMQTDKAGLSKTALGLTVVYSGIVLLLLCLISMLATIFAPFLMPLVFGAIIIAAIMMFVGPIFCLSVPPETKAQGLIVGSVVLQLINLALTIVAFAGIELFGIQAFSQLFGVLSAVLFVLFMRKLALFIGRPDLASRASNVLILAAVVFLVGFAAGATMFWGAQVGGFLFFILAIMTLFLFVMYANLVNYLRKALKSD
jgi:hypothetical protein